MPILRKQFVPEVAITEFKANCLSLLDQVSKTKTPLRVTRRGKAIAEVIPPRAATEERGSIGSRSGDIEITGDIVSPVIATSEIEALNP